MNVVTRSLTAMLVFALTSTMSLPAMAGDGKDANGKGNGCCSRCGVRDDDCGKVCRLVKTEKELLVNCWASECKDFCVAGPSTRGCKNCEPACQDGKGNGKGDGKDCGACDGKGSKGSKGCQECGFIGDGLGNQKFVWYDWIPGCARLHSKKTLLRKTSVKLVPAYKWVLEDLCGKCDSKVKGADIKAGEETLIPTPPKADEAELRYGNPLNLPVKFESAQTRTEGSAEVAKTFASLLR